MGTLPAPPQPPSPPPAKPPRRWLATFVVLLVIVMVTSGGWVAAAALVDPSPPRVDVVEGVTIAPRRGWQVGERFTEPIPGLRLTRGTGNLDTFAAPFPGTSEQLLEAYAARFLILGAQQLQLSDRTDTVAIGQLSGTRVGYIGVYGDRSLAIEGEVTTVVTPSGNGVVFDAWAAQGQLDFVKAEAREMVSSAELP